MTMDVKPIIVVSKCLGFEPCRYNGGMEPNSFVDSLKKYVEFIQVCPESGSGLGIPRNTIKIVENEEGKNLIQSKTAENVTEKIQLYNSKFLSELGEIDGVILKSKSPTCAVKDARIYPKVEKCSALKRGKGFFAEALSINYPNIPMEDEGRLTNFKVREHFLTRLYVLANFRQCKLSKSYEELKKFHMENTLLFLAYSQKYSKVLDGLIYDNSEFDAVIKEYEFNLYHLLSRTPRYTSNINVLFKAIEQFREKIEEEEFQFIWSTIDKYKNGFVPFSVPLHVVKGYLVRFKLDYLLKQTFFMPYPEELIQVTDSGKMIH